jgi:chromosome segregation ATPase
VAQRLSERIQAYANKSFKGYSTIPYNLIREVEVLEFENQKLKERYETRVYLLQKTEIRLKEAEAEVTDLKMEIEGDEEREEVLEKEIGDLKGQIIGLNELNHGLDYCAEQEENKRKDAESRLAKAQAWLQKALDELEDSSYLVMMLSDFSPLKEALGGEEK